MLALTAAAAAWKECMPEAADRAKAVIFELEMMVYFFTLPCVDPIIHPPTYSPPFGILPLPGDLDHWNNGT